MGGETMVPSHPRVLVYGVDPRRYTKKGYVMRVAPDLYGGDLRRNPEAVKLFTDHAKGGDPHRYRYQLLDMLGWTRISWIWRMRQANQVLV